MNSIRNLSAAALLSILPACGSTETPSSIPEQQAVNLGCDEVRQQVVASLMAKAVLERDYPNMVPNMEASGKDIAAALSKVDDPVTCAAEFLPR